MKEKEPVIRKSQEQIMIEEYNNKRELLLGLCNFLTKKEVDLLSVRALEDQISDNHNDWLDGKIKTSQALAMQDILMHHFKEIALKGEVDPKDITTEKLKEYYEQAPPVDPRRI